jgi:OmpA-OmpF porin, OOP family
MTNSKISLPLLFALLIAAPTAAFAEIPARAFHIGVSGGLNYVADDWDLHKIGNTPTSPETSGAAYLRLGAEWNRWLVTEIGVGMLPYKSDGDSNTALDYHGSVLLQLNRDGLVPYLGLGGGAYHNISGGRGTDLDYEVHYALGARYMVTDWLALRAEARHLMTDGYEGSGVANNLLFTGGIDIFAWRADDGDPEAEPEPMDSDGDGIIDANDACPELVGHASASGCPDRDGDGVTDINDACPNTPGLTEKKGCPDSDGDGIIDSSDACPNTFGLSSLGGCPDRDGDGIADGSDECPDQRGTVELKGCPVPMPDEVRKSFEGALEGIYFKTGSAEIQSRSFPVLDRTVETLLKYEGVTVGIEGHTDSRGKDDANRELSQSRAEAVRDYLVSKGVAAGRLEVQGFGEEKPIASNKSKRGRAKNRRIEFRITSR